MCQDTDQLKNRRFPYTEEGMVQLLDQLPAEAVYVMEATGTYHSRLAVRLFEAGCKVRVVNALIIKRYAQMKLRRVKSDPADAALIMQFARHEAPPLWAPASEEVQELHIITDDFTRFEEIKALCAYTGVSPTTFRSGSSVRGKGDIAKMGQLHIYSVIGNVKMTP